MTMPDRVAARVPIGIDFFGSFKSPDKPTPAVIPVKAGKTIAKTLKKSSLLSTVAKRENPVPDISAVGLPIKKLKSDKPRIPTTTYRAFMPMFAPFNSNRVDNNNTAGILMKRLSEISKPKLALIQLINGSKASAKAMI